MPAPKQCPVCGNEKITNSNGSIYCAKKNGGCGAKASARSLTRDDNKRRWEQKKQGGVTNKEALDFLQWLQEDLNIDKGQPISGGTIAERQAAILRRLERNKGTNGNA